MPQDSVYKGTKHHLHTISREAIHPDMTRSVSPQNTFFPTSYDLGPNRVVVPGTAFPTFASITMTDDTIGSPPLWTPQELPIVLPADEPAVDPRTILPSCPLDAMIRAINISSPDLPLHQFDIMTDRKNLRALFNFFRRENRQSHRIDAELVGDTVLFYLGWSQWGYSSFPWHPTYGMSFERKFTSSLSEGTTQHNRVIAYDIGGLKVMVKYQVDACLRPTTPLEPQAVQTQAFTTPTGLEIVRSGTMVSPQSIIEIKTLRKCSEPSNPRTMEQLWFSQTPILKTGYHDGYGRFVSVETTVTTTALEIWEEKNITTLQKVIHLLEMIKEHLSHSLVKRQAIVLENKGPFACVKFFSLIDEQEITLPEDLRQIWRRL
ncbi:hypothetical protein H0H87_005984 [Tephrocybe sp. NHM501043]|nr:hypothetical protein H0H87_005984 [Tephrocybe sp. NHM501043]